MSFRVALAVYNFAGVEEVGHLVLSPEVRVFVSVVLRGREVSVEKHCASRALALCPCFVVAFLGAFAARKPRLCRPWLVRVLNAPSGSTPSAGALAVVFGHLPRECIAGCWESTAALPLPPRRSTHRRKA